MSKILIDLNFVSLPSFNNPRIFYSNQERADLKNTLRKALSKAQNAITLSVYSLTDPQIIALLNKKAQLGVKVNICIDKKSFKALRKKCTSKIDIRVKKQSGLMHQKIFLIDEWVFIGSSNLTTTSLRMHDNLMLGFHSKELKKQLSDYLINDKALLSEQITNGLELYLLPSKKALNRLLFFIEHAEKEIQVALFTFTHPDLLNALIQAHKRGVEVKVILDYLSTKGASRFVTAKLVEASIPLYHNRGVQLMHHKMAFIDQKTLILGSTNWTKSAFEKNQDDLLILTQLSAHEVKKNKKIWKHLFWESKQVTQD